MKPLDIRIRLFKPLRRADKHSILRISPDELDVISIVFIILYFIARSIKSILGLGTPFTRTPDTKNVTVHKGAQQTQLYTLPDLSLSMPLRLDTNLAQRFSNAINSQPNSSTRFESNKVQLCLFLAAASEPAILLLLLKRGCPINPLGAVNVRNRFELLQPGLCRSIIEGTNALSSSTPLSLLARFPRPARLVRRGIEIDAEVTILLTSQNSGTPTAIFRQEFTFLQFTHTNTSQSNPPPTAQAPPPPTTSTPLKIRIPTTAPNLWAKLCKDYNPIHFSAVLARLLGQRGQLAHGNHVVGLCVQAMADAVGSSSGGADGEWSGLRELVKGQMEGAMIGKDRGCRVDVRFRRPVVLPATVGVRVRSDGEGFDIVEERSGKACIEVDVGVLEER